MFSAFYFYSRSLHIIFWPWGLLTFYASQMNVNLFSVSVVILTEKLQSLRKQYSMSQHSRNITLSTQRSILLQKLSVEFI